MSTEINIIRKICSELGWKYKDTGNFIILGFEVNNLTVPIFVSQKHNSNNENPIIEISYKGIYFSIDLDKQSNLAKLVLKRNKNLTTGEWSIKKNPGYEDDYVFKYDVEKQNLNTEFFFNIIEIFISEIKYYTSIYKMLNEFRLIQLIESIDNITKDEIEIYEMTPIEYNFNKIGYNFNPVPSTNNYFFIYLKSENLEADFMYNREEIMQMDLTEFELKIIKTPEGERKSFFSKKLIEKRKK